MARGHFVINLMTEAMAPTNTAANPGGSQTLFETGGKSLLDGLSHLARIWYTTAACRARSTWVHSRSARAWA